MLCPSLLNDIGQQQRFVTHFPMVLNTTITNRCFNKQHPVPYVDTYEVRRYPRLPAGQRSKEVNRSYSPMGKGCEATSGDRYWPACVRPHASTLVKSIIARSSHAGLAKHSWPSKQRLAALLSYSTVGSGHSAVPTSVFNVGLTFTGELIHLAAEKAVL